MFLTWWYSVVKFMWCLHKDFGTTVRHRSSVHIHREIFLPHCPSFNVKTTLHALTSTSHAWKSAKTYLGVVKFPPWGCSVTTHDIGIQFSLSQLLQLSTDTQRCLKIEDIFFYIFLMENFTEKISFTSGVNRKRKLLYIVKLLILW